MPETLPTDSASSKAHSERLDRTIRALLATPVDRAFESGRLFNEISTDKHYLALGYATFEDYLENLEASKFKRATAYANMKLAMTFDQEKYGHIGVGKLRLLMADYVPDPIRLLEEGVQVSDRKGGHEHRAIKDITCRHLGQILRKMRPATEKAGRKRKQARPQDEALGAKIAEAAQILTTSAAADASPALVARETKAPLRAAETAPIEVAELAEATKVMDEPDDARFSDVTEDLPAEPEEPSGDVEWSDVNPVVASSRRSQRLKVAQAS